MALANVTAFGQTVARSEASHVAMADQVNAVAKNLAEVGNARALGRDSQLIDARHLVPEVFTGDRTSTLWRDWDYRSKTFVQARSPVSRRALNLAERRLQPIADEHLQNFGIGEEEDNSLHAMLALKTKDGARVVFRQSDLATGLEQAVSVACSAPRARYGRLRSGRSPGDFEAGCRVLLGGLRGQVPGMESRTQARLNRVGPGAALADSVRSAIWISVLPPKDCDDVRGYLRLWATAEDLERHLLQMTQDRTAGPAPAVMGLSEEDDLEAAVDEETGDTVLYRVAVKQGSKFRIRVGVRPAGGRNGERLRYCCGRPGHVGKECQAKTCKDGGPLRMLQGARGRTSAGAVDEETTEGADQTPLDHVPIGGLDLCAIDAPLLDAPPVISLTELIPAPRTQPTAAKAAVQRQRQQQQLRVPPPRAQTELPIVTWGPRVPRPSGVTECGRVPDETSSGPVAALDAGRATASGAPCERGTVGRATAVDLQARSSLTGALGGAPIVAECTGGISEGSRQQAPVKTMLAELATLAGQLTAMVPQPADAPERQSQQTLPLREQRRHQLQQRQQRRQPAEVSLSSQQNAVRRMSLAIGVADGCCGCGEEEAPFCKALAKNSKKVAQALNPSDDADSHSEFVDSGGSAVSVADTDYFPPKLLHRVCSTNVMRSPAPCMFVTLTSLQSSRLMQCDRLLLRLSGGGGWGGGRW